MGQNANLDEFYNFTENVSSGSWLVWAYLVNFLLNLGLDQKTAAADAEGIEHHVSKKTLIKMDVPLKEMRGKTHDYHGTPLRVTYHPAALLRNSNFKKPTWDDFQWVRDFLNN